METICLQCGDIGFDNAFVYCVKCLDAAVHRYCLDVIPKTFDEYVRWVCDDCETEEKPPDHDVILSQNRGIVSKNIQKEEHFQEEGIEQLYEGTPMQLVRKKKANGNRRKKRRVKKSTVEIYEHSTPSKQSHDEWAKRDIDECTRSADDSTLHRKMEENEGPTLENPCAETNVQGRNHIESEESKDVEMDFRENIGISSAEPVVEPIWRGSFNIQDKKRDIIDGIVAHTSSKACRKVYEEATQFQSMLHFKMHPKSDVWPKSFKTSQPSGDNIALYFFPSEISRKKFDKLVEEMTRKELGLKAFVKNAELLIFTSTELPLLYWRFQGRYYLWGVFRAKQNR